MKFNKTEIARRQIDTAIDLFLENRDFVSALTLAGAGEEIIGKLLERKRKKNILQQFHVEYQQTTAEKVSFSDFSREVNQARNALKHANDTKEDKCEVKHWETLFMIMRAMTNYRGLVGKSSKKMKIMHRWILKMIKNKGKMKFLNKNTLVSTLHRNTDHSA